MQGLVWLVSRSRHTSQLPPACNSPVSKGCPALRILHENMTAVLLLPEVGPVFPNTLLKEIYDRRLRLATNVNNATYLYVQVRTFICRSLEPLRSLRHCFYLSPAEASVFTLLSSAALSPLQHQPC